MNFVFTILGLVCGLAGGVLAAYLLYRVQKANVLARAKAEADRMTAEAREEGEHLLEEAKLAAGEIEDELWAKVQNDITTAEGRVEKLDEEYRKRRSQIDRDFHADARDVQKQVQAVQENEKQTQAREEKFNQRKKSLESTRLKLIGELQKVSGLSVDELKNQLQEEYAHQMQVDARKKASQIEEDVKLNAEEIAKRIIATVLNRFMRAACTERGVGIVEIPNETVKARMLGPDGANIKLLQTLCNLEINVTDANTFQVVGFDPISRELATRTLEKLLHERAPNEESVRRIFAKTQESVMRKIESDGNRVAAELGQRDLHPDIKKMLGTLRYRYSFAQNQHFHVAEVGWLCGLLAHEIGNVHVGHARRVGLLHDVGKAMDHAIEGGHAVIGADFIHKLGEKPHIVHAVRAHHYEEQPSTDIAFLVIAADAMSGARPGARRSTVTVYNQKIEALTTIAESYPGVNKTLILNAGREVRVMVDGRRINDENSLKLCRDIADRIEEECQYPGQIKVVVIRETHAEAMAK